MFEDEMTEADAVRTDAEYRELMARERHEAALDEAHAFERAVSALAHLCPTCSGAGDTMALGPDCATER